MTTITNSNGCIYYVEAIMKAGYDNVLLLSYYGKKSIDEIQAGAEPIQYVVARGWSEKYKCWDHGSYFNVWYGNYTEALEAAKECFKEHAERIFYYM